MESDEKTCVAFDSNSRLDPRVSAAGTFKVDLALALPVGIVAMLIVVFGLGRFVKRLTG